MTKHKYTVVGAYIDQHITSVETEGLDVIVEWVTADSPAAAWQAMLKANARKDADEERGPEAGHSLWPVAIFPGHLTDRMPNGMLVSAESVESVESRATTVLATALHDWSATARSIYLRRER